MKNVIDPFGTSDVRDYQKLFDELGLQPLEPLLARIRTKNMYMRRGIEFAHRDFDKFLKAHEAGKPVAVMSGIKPSFDFHLGSKMTAEEIIFFQKEFGCRAFYAVADLESMVDNQIPLERAKEIAIDNVADLLALGLDPKNAYIYRQSQQKKVMELAFLYSRKATLNHLRSLYGERLPGLYFSAFIQCGDITLPQTKEFGGPKHVLVPVGVDQDPHMRLVRDVVAKTEDNLHFVAPSAIYHKFFRTLSGDAKMSKRDPMNTITLNDDPKTIPKKIANALTGGRDTVAEQKKLGGRPELCVVYELCKYHFIEDDKKLENMRRKCVSGATMCGECKANVVKIIVGYLEEHQAKKKKLLPKARSIIEEN